MFPKVILVTIEEQLINLLSAEKGLEQRLNSFVEVLHSGHSSVVFRASTAKNLSLMDSNDRKKKLNWHSKVENQLFSSLKHIFRQVFLKKL